jgi:hypothetical protein
MTPLLSAALKAVEDCVPPPQHHDYLAATTGAMKIALHGHKISIWASLYRSADPIHGCAASAVSICLMLRDLADLDLPIPVLKLAAEEMMIRALNFVHSAEKISVGAAELARARRIFGDLVDEYIGQESYILDTSISLVGGNHVIN